MQYTHSFAIVSNVSLIHINIYINLFLVVISTISLLHTYTDIKMGRMGEGHWKQWKFPETMSCHDIKRCNTKRNDDDDNDLLC